MAGELSDEGLMALYQNGDEEAFKEIYARYGKRIYAFLRRRVIDPDVCAELFQETFLRLHKSRSLYRSEMPFRSWLYAIANNLIRDNVRSALRSRLSVTSTEEENVPNGVVHDDSDIVLSFKEVFSRLTDDQRQAIMLSRFEGLRYDEIGRVMGRSTEAVNQLIQRGLRRLREWRDEL